MHELKGPLTINDLDTFQEQSPLVQPEMPMTKMLQAYEVEPMQKKT